MNLQVSTKNFTSDLGFEYYKQSRKIFTVLILYYI